MNSNSFLSSKEYSFILPETCLTILNLTRVAQEHIGWAGLFRRPDFGYENLTGASMGRLPCMVQREQGSSWPGPVHTWACVLAVNDGHFFPKWTDLGFCMTFIEQKLNVEICMAFVVRLQSENIFSEHMQNVQHFCDEIVCFEAKVFKRHHGAYMTAKAWNGRILCHWLSDCTDAVYAGVYPPAGSRRLLGRWLQANGHVVHDERLLHQKLAMNSDCFKKNAFVFPFRWFFHIFSSLGFPMVCRFEQRLQSNFNIFCKSDLALQHPPTLFTTM